MTTTTKLHDEISATLEGFEELLITTMGEAKQGAATDAEWTEMERKQDGLYHARARYVEALRAAL